MCVCVCVDMEEELASPCVCVCVDMEEELASPCVCMCVCVDMEEELASPCVCVCVDMEEEELASPCTPPLSALIGDRSFASLGNLVSLMQSREEGHAHTNLGADTSAGVEEDRSSGAGNEEQGLSGISDISLDSPDEESEDGAPLPVEVGVVSTEKAISVASSDNTVGVASPETHLGVVISEKPVGVPSAEKAVCVVSSEKAVAGGSVDVSDVSSDSLDGPPVGPTGVTLTEPMGVVESGGVAESMGGEISEGALVAAEEPAKPMETESGSGLASSGSGQFGSGSGISDDAVIAPPTSPSALPTPLKTPGKRKVCHVYNRIDGFSLCTLTF